MSSKKEETKEEKKSSPIKSNGSSIDLRIILLGEVGVGKLLDQPSSQCCRPENH